jgi:hypothetical protein
MGFLIVLTGISNLEHRPTGSLLLVIFIIGVSLALTAGLLIARYYRDHYGDVTPTRKRQIRSGVAVLAWVAVLAGATKLLSWMLGPPLSVYVIAFALATLAYYAILVGVRVHHVTIWGCILLAGLLPIWGGLGSDRDAIAMFPLGTALIASGLLDQHLLARSFRSAGLNLGNSNVAR